MTGARALVGVLALAAGACTDPEPAPYVWELPAGQLPPYVPADNPMSAAKVELGRHLFFDTRLSITGEMACASCHDSRHGFSDPRAQLVGATGQPLPRASMGLSHVGYFSTFTWANPVLANLEEQVVIPLYGDSPIELGVGLDEPGIFARLDADPVYAPLIADAFPGQTRIDRIALVRSLAAFLRTFITQAAPYDRWAYGGETGALTPAAIRGFELFNSERLECYHCHAPNLGFTGAFRVAGQQTVAFTFENDGLYNIGNTGAYPADNRGLAEFTSKPADEGKFRVPSLRNVMITAPYMHDGSMTTIDEVIDMYARGGRLIESGPYAGDGALSPNKSLFVRGFTLTAEERADLKAALDSLTDPTLATDPRFASPFSP